MKLLDTAGGDLDVALLRATVLAGRNAAHRASAVLAGEGFTLDEWLILEALGGADGLSMSEVRDATRVDKATLGRRVDRLVGRSLVFRAVDDADRRVIRCFLSSRGRQALSRLASRLAYCE